MSVELLDAAGRRRSPATLPVIGAGVCQETKDAGTPLTHHASRRSSRSCAPPVPATTVTGSAR